MKKIILISLILIILAAGGLFAYVSQIDWNTQKEKISAQMSDITGKKIQFSGNLQVTFFPQPQLYAKDVHILNSSNGEKLATIKQLETEVSLSSLLKGKPDIKSLLLEGVEAWFTFDKDGICNWRQKSKQDSMSEGNAFNLRSFNIQKSVIHFNHKKYDISFDLTGFNADVTVGGYDGPYHMDGSFLKNDERYGLALNVDALSQLDDVGMSLAITHPKTESNLRYDGNYNVSADGIKGDFSGQSQRTADFINSLLNKKIISEDFNLPMMFSTSVQSGIDGDELSNLVIRFDKLMEGAGNISVSPESQNKKRKVDIKYQLVKLNILPFAKLIEEYFHKYQSDEKYEPNFGFDVSYDVSSERVTVSNEPSGVIENMSIEGEFKDNILSVDDFYAACPGNIVMNLKATLEENVSKPEYYLGVKLNGQNALSFANALGIKLKAPRQSSYRDIDLSFDLHGTPQHMDVENIDLKMDKAAITGNISMDLVNKEYIINADADILNLDNYIMPRESAEDAYPTDVLIEETKRLEWLATNKVDVNIKAKSATFGGVSVRDAVINLATDGAGTVAVENATANNLLGVDVDISAIIKNWGKSNLIFEDATFDITSNGIRLLADKWQIKLPKWPLFDRGNIKVSGMLLGNLQKIHIDALAKSGEHSFRYDGILNDENNRMNFSGDILVKTEHLESLLKLLLGDVNGKMYRGPLVANAEVKGNSKSWELKDADIQMGTDKYRANVNIDEDKKVYRVVGSVYTTYLNLMNWINVQKTKSIPKFGMSGDDTFLLKPNFSGDVINYNGYRSLAVDIDLSADKSSYGGYSMNNLQTHVANGQNVLRFQNLKFENKHHSVKGDLQIDYSQTPQMSGNLTVNYPEIKNLGGVVYALGVKDVIINTEFETSAVTVLDMIDNLKGKMSVSGSALTIKGINLAAIRDDLQSREYSKGLYQAVRENTQSGETSFEKFATETVMNGGVFTLFPFVLKNADTKVNVSGSVNLKEWKLNDTFKIKYANLEEIPGYAINFSGMLNKPTIDIDIKEIANKYDKHWEALEQERLRRQELIRQQKAEKTEEIRGLIVETEEKSTATLRELEDGMSKHLTKEIVDKYKKKMNEINVISGRLEEIKAKLNSDLSDAEMEQIKSDVINSQQQIETVKSGVKALFIEDIEAQKKELSLREAEIYTKIKGAFDKFQSMWQDDRDQLGKYNSLEYIDGNEELNRNYSQFYENKNSADNIHLDVESRYKQFDSLDNPEDRHALAESIANLIEQEENLYSQMDLLHSQSSDVLLRIIGERRIAFEKEQRETEEERRKQAEIDAQNLLISDNPNPIIKDTGIGGEENTYDASRGGGDNYEDILEPRGINNSSGVQGKIIVKYGTDKEAEKPAVQSSGSLLTPIRDGAPVVSGSIKLK